MAKQLVFLFFFFFLFGVMYGNDRYDTRTAVMDGMDTETVRRLLEDQLEIWTKPKPVSPRGFGF